jgi:Cu-Zn family superoxide dismutase
MNGKTGRVLATAGLALTIFGAGTGAGVASAQPAPAAVATAELRDGTGALIGMATFAQVADGVLITGQLRGLDPGLHGVHLHAVGQCEAPFATAGGHWNPTGRQHGIDNPNGPHLGDVYNQIEPAAGSNVRIGPNGSGTLRAIARGSTVAPGPASIFDADGNALLIHAHHDDNVTDPSGDSGDRLACGVIVAGPVGLPRTGTGDGADAGAAG